MKTYKFFWKVAGKLITSVRAYTLEQAKGIFAQEHKEFALVMNEVYVELS